MKQLRCGLEILLVAGLFLGAFTGCRTMVTTSSDGSDIEDTSQNSGEYSGEESENVTTMDTMAASDSSVAGTGSTFASTPITKDGSSATPSTMDITTPYIVETVYPTEDVVVADYIVTNSDFGADNTGVNDSTKAIQKALYRCSLNGGGTVWMPVGTYRITGSITIPAFVTLRGDWQDPDQGNKYGTIILADVPSTTASNNTGLFYIGGSAGAMGLTVYYPSQNVNAVQPYPYTFYVKGQGDGYMLQSIVNCTVINGYKGIGACVGESNAHEMMTVENFKGTFLSCGATAYNQADVGTWKNVTISNAYWANAGAGLKAADRSALDAYTTRNTTGLVLGDLEWTEFANLSISDCYIGVNIVKGKRIEFAGSMYGVKINGCSYGIKIDSMDNRWGMVLASSSVQGSVAAVQNNTSGQVRMTDVSTSGTVSGKVLTDTSSLSSVSFPTNSAAPKPKKTLYVVSIKDTQGVTDVSKAVQAVLDMAGQSGGGIVYLPAGKYRLDNPLAVPAGVELRGAGSVAQREQGGDSNGTLLYAYYGLVYSQSEADSSTALITLDGENAGVRDVRFVYPEAVTLSCQGTCHPYSYTIRGKASGVYAVNVAITGGYNGVDFRKCNNHLIKKLVGCCFSNMMHVGGSGGVVEGCLQNGNALCRDGIPDSIMTSVNESTELFPQVFNKLTRVLTTYIQISDASNETIYNTFAYGVKSMVQAVNSADTKLVNIGSDNLGSTMLIANGGSLTAVNAMRYNGSSYSSTNCQLRLYNRLTISQLSEEPTV